MADLDPNADLWEIRLGPADLEQGLYSVMLHDPATWTQAGPYLLQFPNVDSAFTWLQEFAHVDIYEHSMGNLARGEFVQGTVSPRLWHGIISALRHCAHRPAPLAADAWVGAVPPRQQADDSSPVVDLRLEERTSPEVVDTPEASTVVTELVESTGGTEDEEGWTRLIEFVAALIALTDDVVVVSVDTQEFKDGDAYVQLCREDEGALTLEAVSSHFLDTPLSSQVIASLHDLGWQDPPGEGLPNYVQFRDADDAAPGDVAALLVQTLRVAYSAQPGDLYQFAPGALSEQLLRGDFGPRFMLDPDMPEGRKARRYLGMRFPHYLAP